MHAPLPTPTRAEPARSSWAPFDVALVILGVWWVARLAGFARGAVLQTDECYHAVVAQWIAAHGRLPREIPGLYSGFRYFYPPLFHLLGAAWVRTAGAGALRYLNVAVTAGVALAAWWAARRMAGRDAGRWAAALVMTSTGIAQYAARVYVEALSTLLAVLVLAALAELARHERRRDALILGVATGLAWLAKPSALVFPALWAVLAALAAWRGRRQLATRLGQAVAVAGAVATPYWLRDWVLFGSPLYPAGAHDRHLLVDRLNQTKYSLAPLEFYRQEAASMGLCVLFAALLTVVLARRAAAARRFAAAIGAGAVMIALAPLQPMVEPRHLNPVVAMLAVLAAVGLSAAFAGRARAAVAMSLVTLLAAGGSIATLADPRPEFDPDPAVMTAYPAVRRLVPEGDTVLSLWTYDTYYYTGRAATWPIPWGQREHPVEMFTTDDCDSVAAALARHHIGWVLLPADTPGEPVFDGANYPASFVRCLGMLETRGRAEVAWRSDDLELVRMR